jgi:hypothetical protein
MDLNRHYEAAWTESFVHLRCYHEHKTLLDAARCAEEQGYAGWYCIAVTFDQPRQLNRAEEKIVNEFRFRPSRSELPARRPGRVGSIKLSPPEGERESC